MNLCDLPDDILYLVLKAAMVYRGRIDLPLHLAAAAKRLRAAAGKLAGVVTLNLYVVAEKRMLGWDGADATDHETDIKAIYDDIVAAIPGVLSLGLTLGSPDSVAQELGQRLVVHYSGQLENLSISGPVAVPRNTEFKQLKRLNLEYGCIGTSRPPRDDSAVLAMVRRALEKAYKCETRELVVPGNTSPTVIGMVVSAPVTHLTLHLASMDVVTDLIRRTSNVTTLSIIRLSTDNVQPDILVPSPDSGHTVEPLNTGITELRSGC
ncbi:hypothetical protein H4R18_005036 [Coemansia javaensis]|uniref:Uncharacterized protein n=1 Tax=Coemansia javaensis TaxID=2761396 RepID=A0A9W8H924_9FUNG|nr:hypothetical protein H4R18_005036 [Coemansia javaensis]